MEDLRELTHRNGVLEAAVKQAIKRLSEKGVDGCTTKDVILASFGSLTLHGGLATCEELTLLSNSIRRFGWKVIGLCIAALLGIITTLVIL
jgi:hypothetical protein